MNDNYRPAAMEVKSAVHRDTMEAYIFLTNGHQQWRMTPEQAALYGQALIFCAASALQDALLVRFLKEEVGLRHEAISHALGRFQQWKEEREEAEEVEQQRRREQARRAGEGN